LFSLIPREHVGSVIECNSSFSFVFFGEQHWPVLTNLFFPTIYENEVFGRVKIGFSIVGLSFGSEDWGDELDSSAKYLRFKEYPRYLFGVEDKRFWLARFAVLPVNRQKRKW
jgi:hypothetical protein